MRIDQGFEVLTQPWDHGAPPSRHPARIALSGPAAHRSEVRGPVEGRVTPGGERP